MTISRVHDAEDAHELERDGRRVRGNRTREAILRRAVDIASVEGLEGLSIGRLASEVGLSKGGLFAHFRSKEQLQLQTVAYAQAIFADVLGAATEGIQPGLLRLLALLAGVLDYFRSGIFAGGCFFATVTAEFDSRPPGPVRDTLLAYDRRGQEILVDHVRAAQELRELDATADPEQIAFELNAFGCAANLAYQLHRDEIVFQRAATAMRQRLYQVATRTGRGVLTRRDALV